MRALGEIGDIADLDVVARPEVGRTLERDAQLVEVVPVPRRLEGDIGVGEHQREVGRRLLRAAQQLLEDDTAAAYIARRPPGRRFVVSDVHECSSSRAAAVRAAGCVKTGCGMTSSALSSRDSMRADSPPARCSASYGP